MISMYFFNNFLRFFCEGYLEISFGAILNSYKITDGSIPADISFYSALVISIICLIFPFMTAALLYDKRKEIANENEIYLKRFGTMYKDFDAKKHWSTTMFYPLFLLRRLGFVMLLIMLTSYPEIQFNIFILSSISVSCYKINLL